MCTCPLRATNGQMRFARSPNATAKNKLSFFNPHLGGGHHDTIRKIFHFLYIVTYNVTYNNAVVQITFQYAFETFNKINCIMHIINKSFIVVGIISYSNFIIHIIIITFNASNHSIQTFLKLSILQ